MRRSTLSPARDVPGNRPARAWPMAPSSARLTTIEAAVPLTDLRGFSNLSERHSPQVVLDHLGDYFRSCRRRGQASEAMSQRHSSATAGLDLPGRAGRGGSGRVRAVEAIARVNTGFRDLGSPIVTALHVGPVVYGNIGSPRSARLHGPGPTVTVASGLEAIAKAGRPECLLGAARAARRDLRARSSASTSSKALPAPRRSSACCRTRLTISLATP